MLAWKRRLLVVPAAADVAEPAAAAAAEPAELVPNYASFWQFQPALLAAAPLNLVVDLVHRGPGSYRNTEPNHWETASSSPGCYNTGDGGRVCQ